MGQYFKPVPLPAGTTFSCGHIRTAFTSAFSDVKITPPFTGNNSRSFPCTLLSEVFKRPVFAIQGGLNHVC